MEHFINNLECRPGYFGMNCSSPCEYPYYGQSCQSTCDCKIKDCNHIDGCPGNHSHAETSTSLSTKHTSSRVGYDYTSKIYEGKSLKIHVWCI